MGESMSTLTMGNLTWDIQSHEGKAAFVYGVTHAIVWHPASKGSNILEKGEPVFWSKFASECLTEANGIVLDYFARMFTPSWEYNGRDTLIDISPFGETYVLPEYQRVS